MVWVRRAAIIALAFGAGVLIGPVLAAVIAGLSPARDPAVPLAGAMRLLDAYAALPVERRQPPELSWEAAARGCGYDPGTMIDDAMPPAAAWTPFLGYFDLRMWMGGDAAAAVRAQQARQLAAALTPFEQGFLDACLRATAFAPLCRQRVAAVLARDTPQAALATLSDPRDRETLCHFLDGVAARRGRPLAARAGIVMPPSAPMIAAAR